MTYPQIHGIDKPWYLWLQEVLCPLYAWCKGHCKRGSIDTLVTEDRLALLMFTYSPNLWRVFLMYAQDAVGKTQDVHLLFPEYAQANEKGRLAQV